MPMCRGKWASACLVSMLLGLYAANGWSDNLSGQVSQNAIEGQNPPDVSWPGAITKALTLTPGAGQFSADHLHFGRQVVITLYNPNPYAMRFDTTQRLGKEYSWVVPANSQRTVAFRYWNPVSDEVKFLTYQDPASLAVSNGQVTQPQTAEVPIGPPQPAVSSLSPTAAQSSSNVQQETIGPLSPPVRSESKAAVRGYW